MSTETEIERLRMQLVACGVVALANTPESAAKQRAMHPDYMSDSCKQVMVIVDKEMEGRARIAQLEGDIAAHLKLIEKMADDLIAAQAEAERWRFFRACMDDDYIDKLEPLMSVLDETGVETADQADAHMDKCIQIARDNGLWPWTGKQVAP